MSAWKDPSGRIWRLNITVHVLKRVRDLAGVNLLEVLDGQLLHQLSDDPVLLVNTLWAVVKPQADAEGVTEEAFAELLVGDAIENAAAAFVEGLLAFFPRDRREPLTRVWTATDRVRREGANLILKKLDATLDSAIAAAMDQAEARLDRDLRKFIDASGSLPESSASIPAP